MKKYSDNLTEDRIYSAYNLYAQTELTIREIAELLKTSKSTIHHDLNVKLKKIDPAKYKNFTEIAEVKKYIGQMKGGEVTGKKYKK